MPTSRKANKPKSDLAEEGPSGATDWLEEDGSDTTTGSGNENAVLVAKAFTLRATHGDKIEEKIGDVTVILRAEIAALKTEID